MSDFPPITDIAEANRKIAQLRDELRKALDEATRTREKMRSTMQKLAREFRIPLTTVLGFSDFLSATDKSHGPELNQIAIASHDLMELIKRLEDPVLPPDIATGSPKKTEGLEAMVHTILYVEDNETNFRLTERILEDRPNLELLWAPNGQDALELACKHSPTLILLDLNLPDIHGSEVLARLRNNSLTSDIPVIVLSADASPSRIEKMLQAGARNYLTKPFDIKRLLCLVDETIHSAQTLAL
jgi:CheY-like chemotaxis protein